MPFQEKSLKGILGVVPKVFLIQENHKSKFFGISPMHFSRGDSRPWWFSSSTQPFWGLTDWTRSHSLRDRQSKYPFVEEPSIRRSKIDRLQVACQSLQGVAKAKINLSRRRTHPLLAGNAIYRSFVQKNLHIGRSHMELTLILANTITI